MTQLSDADIAALAEKLTPYIEGIVRRILADGDSDKQLVAITSATMEIVQQATDKIYDDIAEEINREIMPKINRLATTMAYTNIDEQQYTNTYRMAAVAQERDRLLTITDGVSADKIISPFVEKVFTEDEDD